MKKRKLTDANKLAPSEVNIAPADALTDATAISQLLGQTQHR